MTIIRSILQYEEDWCQLMGYQNVYLDPFNNHITDSVTTGDGTAYKRFPENRHVYDKLWVAKTQGMKCGELEELEGKEDSLQYPIFIKPRWGHLSAASKNCFKIKSGYELKKFRGYENMMWSDFIDGTEQMTDFFLQNGRIVYALTYKYSEDQNGFSDVWKYVSPDTPTPASIQKWVVDNVHGHTGFVNVQYRSNKIIEVGLRPARSGAYIIATDNRAIMKNIHNVMDKGYWDPSLETDMRFEPYYAFKCFTRVPIVYIWPQRIVDAVVKSQTDMPLYEYYFEPVGTEGMVFMQFMHKDFDKGMRTKRIIEFLFALTQIIYVAIIAVTLYSLIAMKGNIGFYLLIFLVLLTMTRFLNPLYANYNLYKGYRQMFMGKDSLRTPKEYADIVELNGLTEGE